MDMYEVGGCVRDEIMGVKSSDIDYTVVLDADDRGIIYQRGQDAFDFMCNTLVDQGFKIFLESPEFLTARAQFPRAPKSIKSKRNGLTADFVLARKEGVYTDGRRPDAVEVGDLMDDLARRDFTMNAIAKSTDGELIDPFNGRRDINARIIRCVGDPMDRFTEDALRAVRALRFSVTKDMMIDANVQFAMQDDAVLDAIVNKISDERIQTELSKALRFDSFRTVTRMAKFKRLTEAMLSGSVSLDATMKTRGRG